MNQRHEDEYGIDLRDMLYIIRKRIGMILLIPVVTVLIAASLVMLVMPKIYEASTTLIVGRTPTQSQIAYNDVLLNRQLVKTYRQIAHSNKVMEPVIKKLRLDLTPERLRSMVDVTQIGDTELIRISVEHIDPYKAMQVANSMADSFMSSVIEIMQIDNVTVVDEARYPQQPIKPHTLLITAIAGFLGLMSGLLLVFLLEYLDRSIKTPTDAERYLGLPVLVTIPRFRVSEALTKEELDNVPSQMAISTQSS